MHTTCSSGERVSPKSDLAYRAGGFRSLRRASNRAPPCWISRGLLKKAGENFPFVWDYDSDLLLMCATAVGTGAPFT